MITRQWIRYAFGGFVGFTCGILITLIFYFVERSGHPVLTRLGREYGLLGQAIAEFVAHLPYFGIIIGMLMVKLLFRKISDDSEKQ